MNNHVMQVIGDKLRLCGFYAARFLSLSQNCIHSDSDEQVGTADSAAVDCRMEIVGVFSDIVSTATCVLQIISKNPIMHDIMEITEEAYNEERTKMVKFPCKDWAEFINILHQAMSGVSGRRPPYGQTLKITFKLQSKDALHETIHKHESMKRVDFSSMSFDIS